MLPFSATNCCQKRKLCCRKWQQIVSRNGNKLFPETATNCCRKRQQIVADLLPFSATICCRFRQQFVASVDRPLTIYNSWGTMSLIWADVIPNDRRRRQSRIQEAATPIKGKKECASYLWTSISQLRSVTCRMGSHKRTHPASTPARQAGTRFTDHLRMEG